MRAKAHLEELVNDVDSHVERLLQQLELGVDLHQPIHQHSSHLAIYRTPGDRDTIMQTVFIFPTSEPKFPPRIPKPPKDNSQQFTH